VNCERDEQAVRDWRDPKAEDWSVQNFEPRPSAFPASASAFKPPHPSRFSRKSRESRAKNEIRRYNSMRLFALSIRLRWHEACVPANIMAQGRITFAALIAVSCILVLPYQVPAQQSTAPPSSLSTRSLVPGSPSPNFVRLVTSAESQRRGREAICGLNDFAVRKDCVRTRMRREPIAHWTKASSQCCLVGHSCPQKFKSSGIRKQGT